MKRSLLFLVLLTTLAGCTTPPKAVLERVEAEMSESCKGLYLDRRLQEAANSALMNGYFASAENSNGVIVACGASWGGSIGTTQSQLESMAMRGCETKRLQVMQTQSVILSDCRIYSKNNKLL